MRQQERLCPQIGCGFFAFNGPAHFCAGFFYRGEPIMHFNLIKNPDASQRIVYRVARVVYAETGGTSLRAAEALTSMIANAAIKTKREIRDIVSDKNMFLVLNDTSSKHELLNVDAANRGLQMCCRVAERMLHGNLPDYCYGATMFHHDGVIPDWAMSRGYIADIDGLLFYA